MEEEDDIFCGSTKPLQFSKSLFDKHLNKKSVEQKYYPTEHPSPSDTFYSSDGSNDDWKEGLDKEVLKGQRHELSRGFTDKQLLTCIYVLEKLSLNSKLIEDNSEEAGTSGSKDPSIMRLVELGTSLFHRAVVTSVFGTNSAQEYLQQMAMKKAAEQGLYKKALVEADREVLSSCEIRKVRKQRFEFVAEQQQIETRHHLLISNTSSTDDTHNTDTSNGITNTTNNITINIQSATNSGVGDNIIYGDNSMEPAANPTKSKSSVHRTRRCHVCKVLHHEVHFFYDQMCTTCGDFNYAKRNQTVQAPDGCIALVTGGRIRIGYQIVLKLLRTGATVIVTTRFAHDAAKRFAHEKDFLSWKDRLVLYGGLDFRDLKSVEKFCDFFIANYTRLDVLINNAAQTVWKPPEFYAHLIPSEKTSYEKLPQTIKPLLRDYYTHRHEYFSTHQHALLVESNSSDGTSVDTQTPSYTRSDVQPSVDVHVDAESHVNVNREVVHMLMIEKEKTIVEDTYNTQREEYFPQGKYDMDMQQLDLRPVNSWVLNVEQVPIREVLETHAVSAIAPFIFINKFKRLMVPHGNYDSAYIINVSAMEGCFNRFYKKSTHPHTNMAKASLNMITRTSASGLAKENIFMNSVDTGWVTDELPHHAASNRVEMQGLNWEPPLDDVDGAARVLDPVFMGMTGVSKEWGKFLKDYKEINW